MTDRPRRKSDAARRANQVIRGRTMLIMLLLGVASFTVLFWKLYDLQINRHDELKAEAVSQQTDSMVISTSAIVDTMIDGAVGMNSGIFNNPFIIWGRYRRTFFKTTLNISFQFHHTQMDGAHAGRFLEYLQETIRELRWA